MSSRNKEEQYVKANKSPTQRGRKRSKRVGSIHPTPSKNSPHSPPVYRGEVNLPLSWVCCSYTGVLSTRITRRKRRAAERQSRLIFIALQEGS